MFLQLCFLLDIIMAFTDSCSSVYITFKGLNAVVLNTLPLALIIGGAAAVVFGDNMGKR